jgi:hypothetical protein
MKCLYCNSRVFKGNHACSWCKVEFRKELTQMRLEMKRDWEHVPSRYIIEREGVYRRNYLWENIGR